MYILKYHRHFIQ